MTDKALDLRGLTEGALNVIREDLDAAQAGTIEVSTTHLIAYADNLWHMVRALQEQNAALQAGLHFQMAEYFEEPYDASPGTHRVQLALQIGPFKRTLITSVEMGGSGLKGYEVIQYAIKQLGERELIEEGDDEPLDSLTFRDDNGYKYPFDLDEHIGQFVVGAQILSFTPKEDEPNTSPPPRRPNSWR